VDVLTGKKPCGRALGGALFVTMAVLLPGLSPAALAGEIAAPPNASNFAAMLVLTTAEYAKAHGESVKIERADCVQATRGHYMCSYDLRVPGSPGACHLIQARWTPGRASIFTVTLAGRTPRCQSLSIALHSLR
jgi:hypothetical protein